MYDLTNKEHKLTNFVTRLNNIFSKKLLPLIDEFKPDVIITTGAGVTVPTVFFAKKLLGTKVIFVNSAADVTHASKTPVWIERYSDLFLVQWEEMRQLFPNSICCGVL